MVVFNPCVFSTESILIEGVKIVAFDVFSVNWRQAQVFVREIYFFPIHFQIFHSILCIPRAQKLKKIQRLNQCRYTWLKPNPEAISNV